MFTPLMLAARSDVLMFDDLASQLLFVFALGVPFWLMRRVFFNTTKPGVKVALVLGMIAQYVALVFWLAWIFTGAFASREQTYHAWALAFLSGTIIALMQAFIIYVCRPRRQLSESDMMKLKDI